MSMAPEKNVSQNHVYNNILVCERYEGMTSGGLMLGKDFTKSPLPLLLMQLSVVNILTVIFQILLKPLGQFTFIPQILGGIAIGPSCLCRYRKFREILCIPQMGNAMINAFENLALMLIFFLLSVRADLSVLKRPGRLAFTIGMSILIVPFTINIPLATMLKPYVSNEELQRTLPAVAAFEASTNFQQTLYSLQDLKLLNSELGRIALVSSLIAGTGFFAFSSIGLQLVELKTSVEKRAFVYVQLSQIVMISAIIFLLRPILLWMMRHTPERKPLRESYIFCIIMMVLGCALFGELTGQHPMNGPIMLGMATPDSPPMGSSLSDKLGSFAWSVLMPGYMINIGKRVNVFRMGLENILFVGLMAAMGSIVKIICIIIPSLYYKMPLKDVLPLCLVLTCRGIFDILVFYRAKQFRLIDEDSFTTMVLGSLLHSAIVAPLVRAIYDTSRRYICHDKRTIQHHRRHCELRIVTCIHEQDDVPSMINIIEISNPTKQNPLAIYVLNLEELIGRTMPLFISHKYMRAPWNKLTAASRIINVFHQYEEERAGSVAMQCFTSLAPYSTMHDDICSLAHEKSTALVIVPFPKFDIPYLRAVNNMVLEYAPCSIAIFFGRGLLLEPQFWKSEVIMNVCVAFLGGPDDREALAYGARMAGHPRIKLTVLRFVDVSNSTGDLLQRKHDECAINEVRANTYESNNVEHKEEELIEASDTTETLKFIVKDFDLVLIGRRHDQESKPLKGLAEWTDFEEMGVIGDILVSSDNRTRASVLVVQQQPLVEDIETTFPKQKSMNYI